MKVLLFYFRSRYHVPPPFHFPCLDIHDTFVSWVGSGGADSGGGSQQPVHPDPEPLVNVQGWEMGAADFFR